jgi:hypothetical protein
MGGFHERGGSLSSITANVAARGRLGPAVRNMPEFNDLDDQKQDRGGPSPRYCAREQVEQLSGPAARVTLSPRDGAA